MESLSVCAFFYLNNDHAKAVLLSTFTLVFTVTGGNLKKTWRAPTDNKYC